MPIHITRNKPLKQRAAGILHPPQRDPEASLDMEKEWRGQSSATHVLARTEAKSLKGTGPKSPWQRQALGTCVEHSYQDNLRIPVQRQRERWPRGAQKGQRAGGGEKEDLSGHPAVLSDFESSRDYAMGWGYTRGGWKLQASQVLLRRSPHVWLSCTMQSHSGLGPLWAKHICSRPFCFRTYLKEISRECKCFLGQDSQLRKTGKIKQ